MIVKDIIWEDFSNYKDPCMFIIFPKCSFKCCKEANSDICQNSEIVHLPDIEVSPEYIVKQYMKNTITSAIVFGGLEPFDSLPEMLDLIKALRSETSDNIIIYTGYTEEEIQCYIKDLATYSNIIIKYGRYIPNKRSKYDDLLGVNLASDNQYARRIS